MAYASISGRARTSARSPQAHAICDRCGRRWNLVDLSWQFDWRGPILQNLRFLVCRPCYDQPQEQLRTIVLPADPVPVMNARVQDFRAAESDYRTTSAPPVIDPRTGIPIPGKVYRATPERNNRTTLPFGRPVGNIQPSIPGYAGAVQKPFGRPLDILSVMANGTATIFVTCSSPHGLCTNDQISIEGLLVDAACGMYSVVVQTATAFTYMTYGSETAPVIGSDGSIELESSDGEDELESDDGQILLESYDVAAGSILTGTTRVWTVLIGLPYGYQQIPKIDGPPLWNAPQAVADEVVELESGGGDVELESGDGDMELESG